jgi:uncharacterized protein
MPPALTLSDGRLAALLLAVASFLFLLRVLGQLLVVLRGPSWLPPMEQWYSGLLPYPRLLAVQGLYLAVMLVVIVSLVLDLSPVADRQPGLGAVLVPLAWLYAGSMGVRYAVRMARRPDQRWGGGAIPIAFHVVLAAWLLILASYWVSG